MATLGKRKQALLYILIGVLGLTAILMFLSTRIQVNVTDPGKPVFIYAPVPTPQLVVKTNIITVTQYIDREVMVDGEAPAPAIVGESILVDKGSASTTMAMKPAAPAPEPTGDGGQKLFKSWPLKSSYEALSWYEGKDKEILQVKIPTTGNITDLFTYPSLCAGGGCAELKKVDPANGCSVYAVPVQGWEPITVSNCHGEWKLNVSKGGIARF